MRFQIFHSSGNPEEVTIRQLAEIIIDLSDSRSKIVHHAPMRDDPSRRRPDIGDAEKLLDWWPQTDLREGLKLTLAYFKGVMQQSQGEAGVSRTARIS
jgi:UDP-glucuronate decarboxylase